MPITDRLLLGPGPSNPYPEAVAALGRPMLGHMDPEFLAIMDETMARLRTVFRTTNALTFPVSGTGSAGMEACFVNLLEPGDTAIVGANGVFGDRMCEVARRCGADVVRIEEEWGRALDPQRLLDAQREHPDARLVAVVHAETSTGVENDIAPLAALRDTDTLLLVDTVTSLGRHPGRGRRVGRRRRLLGHPEVPRGAARACRRSRSRPGRSSACRPAPCRRSRGTSTCRSSPTTSTAPAASTTTPRRSRWCCALHAALGAVLDEGLEAAWARHRAVGTRLQAALPELGFRLVVPEGHRLPELTTAWLPDGADDATLRKELLDDVRHRGRRRARASSPGRPGASGSWATPPGSGR